MDRMSGGSGSALSGRASSHVEMSLVPYLDAPSVALDDPTHRVEKRLAALGRQQALIGISSEKIEVIRSRVNLRPRIAAPCHRAKATRAREQRADRALFGIPSCGRRSGQS